MTQNLYEASNHWAVRPNDERYRSVQELADKLAADRPRLGEIELSYDKISLTQPDGKPDIALTLANGKSANFTNWSFGQFCKELKAPVEAMKGLSTKTAIIVLQEKMGNLLSGSVVTPDELSVWDDFGDVTMDQQENKRMKLLLYREPEDDFTVRSITSTQYGRKWDEKIVQMLLQVEPAGWRPPPARPCNVPSSRTWLATADDVLQNQTRGGLSIKEGDLLGPAGVYRAADARNMFIFEVCDAVTLDGSPNGLKRGFFISNSELGESRKVKATFFLYESICGNHIIWGAQKVREISVSHRKQAVEEFDGRFLDALELYAESPQEETKMIECAKSYILGKNKEEVIDRVYEKRHLLHQHLSRRFITLAYDQAVQWEHTAQAPPTSAWGFVHGLTRASVLQQNADSKSVLDTVGGKILDWTTDVTKANVNVPAVIDSEMVVGVTANVTTDAAAPAKPTRGRKRS